MTRHPPPKKNNGTLPASLPSFAAETSALAARRGSEDGPSRRTVPSALPSVAVGPERSLDPPRLLCHVRLEFDVAATVSRG
jgi:hypothetical protein